MKFESNKEYMGNLSLSLSQKKTRLFIKYVLKLEPLTDGKTLFISSILFSLTFVTLISSSVDLKNYYLTCL